MTTTVLADAPGTPPAPGRPVGEPTGSPGPARPLSQRSRAGSDWRARRTLRVPRHRGTTAHLCSAYPFLAEAGLGPRGVYLGVNVLTGGGSFAYDPFTAYADGIVTNPNVLVYGEPGAGKSAATKCLIYRSVGMFGRWAAIVDPKGEYGPLAETLGLPVLELHPGGTTRINPLDPGPQGHAAGPDELARRQSEMVSALLASVLHRDLDPLEDAALGWTITHLVHSTRGATPTLVDVARVLANPTAEMCDRAHLAAGELAQRVSAGVYGLEKLLDRSLRGMFDGPTTVPVDWDGPGLVLDLSAVFHDREALGLVLLAATAWLQAILARPDGRRRLQVLDEAWALFGLPRTARYLQASWKLCRAYGVANIAVVHRLSDLRAQADDGTTTAKAAMGLLADSQTRVGFRQSSDQVADARELLGLTHTEADLLTRLTKGRALWKVAGRTAVVHHVIGTAEAHFCDTDARMLGTTTPAEGAAASSPEQPPPTDSDAGDEEEAA
ncbi:MAG: ATP-binding protein [Acidimicrobiia bacterium]